MAEGATRPARVLHPIGFAAFPVLFLFGQNVGQLPVRQIVAPLLTLIIVVSVSLVALGRLMNDRVRAGFIVSVLVLLFFSYGHVFPYLDGQIVGDTTIEGDLVLLPVWSCFALAAILLSLRTGPRAPDVTRALNRFAVVLVAVSLVPIATNGIGSADDDGPATGPTLRAGSAHKGRPDIYYIILDRYAGQRALSEVYGFDNSVFLDALRRRGFYVADDAMANYPDTAHSLAASLNMRHPDDLTGAPRARSQDWSKLYGRIHRNSVAEFLKQQGYEYVLLGSWWDATRSSPLADHVTDADSGSEFSQVLFDTSVLRPLSAMLGVGEDRWDSRRRHHRRILEQFKELTTADRPGPTFIFAHILTPHAPFTFGVDGRFISRREERALSRKESYRRQVQFANNQLLPIIEHLLSVPKDERPVIIIQADEGAHPLRAEEEGDFAWKRATQAELEEKFPILNAVYFPDGDYTRLYPSISPVNQFRHVFNKYFDTKLPMLPDESYVFSDWDHIFDFIRVTDRVRRSREAAPTVPSMQTAVP